MSESTRLVPVLFDEYLKQRGIVALDVEGNCHGCLEGPRPLWRDDQAPNAMDYCEACLRTSHGADTHEESTVHAIIGGAIRGALDGGAARELIRAAVDDALTAQY